METVKSETQVLFARGVIAPTLKEAQQELMKRARAQGVEGKRFSSEFMKENKQLIDHILALHREYQRNVGEKDRKSEAMMAPLETEEIHIHDPGQKREVVGHQRWDRTTLDLKLRRISTFLEHADEEDLEEFRDRTIAPALKSTLKELKSRAHAQGKEGERYNAAFMKDQKPLIDHALVLHGQYKRANEKINFWKQEYDLLGEDDDLPDLSSFGQPPWELRNNQDTVAPKKSLSGLFRGAMTKAASVVAIALTAAFAWNSTSQNDGKGTVTSIASKAVTPFSGKEQGSEKLSQSLFRRVGMVTEFFNIKAKDTGNPEPRKAEAYSTYTTGFEPR